MLQIREESKRNEIPTSRVTREEAAQDRYNVLTKQKREV
jgi:hypothetical protein